MRTVEALSEITSLAAEWRAGGRTIGLVPTMGALHAGKEALVRAAAAQVDVAVVSIAVNPLQFGPNENPARYPRQLAEDLRICEAAGAACVFAPPEAALLPPGNSTYVAEESVAKPLCGASRPAHFRGVTTVTAKLFNLIRPHRAYFGQKTAQRAAVVRKMCADLGYDVAVEVVPTVREPDGLAVGGGNAGFTPNQRREARALSLALETAQAMVASGVRNPDRLIAEATHVLAEYRRVRVIYVALADARTMEPARELVPGRTMLAIAAWIDEVRLIDNAILV
jgi:pantoate--beta-alanine ligase